MRPYRDVATLAGAQVVCFLILTHLEPGLFLVHSYEAILYIAILVILFYMEDRWAYMIGILASVAWLSLCICVGNTWRQYPRVAPARNPRLEYQPCGAGRPGYRVDRRIDDLLMWPALDQGIFGIG